MRDGNDDPIIVRVVVENGSKMLETGSGVETGTPPHRAPEPHATVRGLSQLHFVRRDIGRARDFFVDFGLQPYAVSDAGTRLRGTWSGAPCVVLEEGRRDSFAGITLWVDTPDEVERLAQRTGGSVEPFERGVAVRLRDPVGFSVFVAADLTSLPSLPERAPLRLNFGERPIRHNRCQRPARAPAAVQRLGHVVVETTRFRAMLEWYLQTLGLIVSDFLYLEGMPERGPVMAFLRCDRGDAPSDHHTVALHLGMTNRLSHAAFQVTDLDAIAAGGEFLKQQGHRRAWGIGRHILGSQIFDYWRGPAGDLFEHYADGDVFDATVSTGWEPMHASGLSQWGPPVSRDFLGTRLQPRLIANAVRALADPHSDIDIATARNLIKAMES